jgi:hypothetical protein
MRILARRALASVRIAKRRVNRLRVGGDDDLVGQVALSGGGRYGLALVKVKPAP